MAKNLTAQVSKAGGDLNWWSAKFLSRAREKY